MKEKCFVSVVTYLCNDGGSVFEYLTRMNSIISDGFESFEFVMVNDFSTDNTVDEIRRFKNSSNATVVVVNMAWSHGPELAILAGNDMAIGDFIVEVDSAALDFPPGLVYEMYQKCTSGTDIVSAVPKSRIKFKSRVFYSLFNSVTGIGLTTETLRIVTRRALNAVLMSKEKIRYRKLLYKLSGYPSASVEYEPASGPAAHHGRSLRSDIALALNVLTSYSDLGLRIAALLSFVFFAFSCGGGLYAILIYIFKQSVVTGWTTTMLFLSFGFSGMFFVMGFLLKYLSMILQEVQNKPLYRVTSVERVPTGKSNG